MFRDGCEIGMLDLMSPCILCEGADYRVLNLWPGRPLKRCRRCGLVTVATKPPVTAIQEYYRCPYAADWLSREADGHRRGLFARLLQEIRTRRAPGRLLDVGCASGLLVHQALQTGWEATGVEISPLACRRAKEEFGLDLFQGELAEACFPEAAFDVVTFVDVLDHLDDPLGQLREAYRVLKPGGLLVVRVPNFPVQSAVRRLSLALGRLSGRLLSDFGVIHFYNFSCRTLKLLLEKAGFCEVEVRPSWMVGADLCGPLGHRWTRILHGAKRLAFLTAHMLFRLSGARWVGTPSIEAYGERWRPS